MRRFVPTEEERSIVKLNFVLPETGVCSNLVALDDASAGWCGGSAPARTDACCNDDACTEGRGGDTLRCARATAPPVATTKQSCCGGARNAGQTNDAAVTA
jgi:hypothetical protein